MHSATWLPAAVLLGSVLSGRADTGPLPPCAGPVTVTVSAGTSPTIRWTPECQLFMVLVEDSTNGADQWVVEDSANAIVPPVEYGKVPTRAKALLEPRSLQPGHGYRVVVLRFPDAGLDDGARIGQLTFTP